MRDSEGHRPFQVGLDHHVPDDVERLLAELPEWFGIPSATACYVEAARRLETWTARDEEGSVVAVVLLKRHFESSAEVHLMAVQRDLHGRGIGRRLLGFVEDAVLAEGVRLLQVKTLGPSRPHDGYAATRAFYRSVGFIELEETNLWGDANPCLLLVKPL